VSGRLHTAGGVDYFIWNNNGDRLINGPFPPFIRGKSKCSSLFSVTKRSHSTVDNWFIHEVISAGVRVAIDGTEATTALHVNHGYVSESGNTVDMRGKETTFWQSAKDSNWQIFHNVELGYRYGSYVIQKGTSLHSPFKLIRCRDTKSGICLQERVRPAVCMCEHSAFAAVTQTDPMLVSMPSTKSTTAKIYKCGATSSESAEQFRILSRVGQISNFGLSSLILSRIHQRSQCLDYLSQWKQSWRSAHAIITL
jgi:hypothetical protein